ncbi:MULTISPECIES: acyl carrier protein [Actinoplanes]|uniref:Actinorhodin polyketide synthase n=2 Tax=Actinoplanes TaxID=1865 RepID=A0A0X3V4D3_9ACTN|nr:MULTISPECIES: acyl carrier protein [Actinoplanes]KUL39528.1 actinorhodin polyketide synthase [Actinoplanes awajinensis subsp. mycoplanecinus]GIE64400.1 actinorhodin polyketide synthase acyl carrier protein [Actinoplanes palleronii]
MAELSIETLFQLLKESAGEEEGIDLSGDSMDREFELLGYDSLAMLNTVSRIERENGIRLPDSVVADARTPRELLDEVNNRLQANA